MKNLFTLLVTGVFLLTLLPPTPAFALPSAPIVAVNPPGYHCILGSYKTFDSAREFTLFLRNQGINASIVFPQPGSDTYRVSGFSSNDRRLVEAFSNSLKRQGKFKSNWIFAQLPEPYTPQVIGQTGPQATGTKSPDALMRSDADKFYYLIVGSYDDYASAEVKVRELEVNGYEPNILLPTYDAPKYRVYVYVADNKPEIKAYQDRLNQLNRDKGWIYTQDAEMATFSQGLSDLSAGNARGASTTAVPVAPSSQVNYYLIGASYRKLDKAQEFAHEMTQLGFYPVIIPPNAGSKNYRVSLYHAENREEVAFYSQQLMQVQAHKYWIYAL